MKQINIDQCLFYGIHPYYYELVTIAETQVNILRNILSVGYIPSRRYLKNILPTEELDKLTANTKHNPNWNENDYISISTSKFRTNSFPGHFDNKINHDCIDAYDLYIKGNPSIILNNQLLHELTKREQPYNNMPGEIQIKDIIPIKFFMGIALPHINLDLFFEYFIKTVMCEGDNNDDIPDWYSWYDEAEGDLFCLSDEEFIQKYYHTVIIFENLLEEMHSDLGLFHTETGLPILSSKDKIKQVKELKKLINELKKNQSHSMK